MDPAIVVKRFMAVNLVGEERQDGGSRIEITTPLFYPRSSFFLGVSLVSTVVYDRKTEIHASRIMAFPFFHSEFAED